MLNDNIFFFFYNLAHQSEIFDQLVIFTADVFPYIVILAVGIFLLVHHDVLPSRNPFKEFAKKWREIIFVFFSCGIAWLVATVLKVIFHAPRPFIKFSDVTSLFPETGYAFPSQHSVFFAALAVSIFFCHKKAGYLFMLCAFLIGLARITSGVHFPIDILGGLVLGAGIAFFLKKV